MSIRAARGASHVTLAGCTLLHAFTHGYQTMFAPMYLVMARELGVGGVGWVTAVVAVYTGVYFAGAYPAGVLADRFDRRVLLAVGTIGNGVAIALMGFTSSYAALMGLGVVAGVFGALFHPTANALVPAHYPGSPGMAIGLLGIGSGIGFFGGPEYAGWRAKFTGGWQRPCVELGIAGVVCGVLFLLIAKEAVGRVRLEKQEHPPLGARLRWRAVGIAMITCWRDFAGAGALTLVSVFLQKAHGLGPGRTGFVIGGMMLASVIVNPLMVYWSAGRRRLVVLAGILVGGGAVLASVPWWPLGAILPVLCVFQAMHLGSYAVGDASVLERIPAEVRGRFVGVWLTIVGLVASTATWLMGWWTDRMGAEAYRPRAYWGAFLLLGGMMAFAATAVKVIGGLGDEGKREAVDAGVVATMAEEV